MKTNFRLRVTHDLDPYSFSPTMEYEQEAEMTAPHGTDLTDWAHYISDGINTGQSWDRISAAPRPVRDALQISRHVAGAVAMPHTLRGDEGPRHLDPKHLARLFNCHPTVAARLADQFTTFELGDAEIRQFADTATQYGGPLGLAIHLETLALRADIHPIFTVERDTHDALDTPCVSMTASGAVHANDEDIADMNNMDDDPIFSGHFEPVAYHKVDTTPETPDAPIVTVQPKTAWPTWVTHLPEWTRQMLAELDHSRERAYQAATLMGQRGGELSSSARTYMWTLIKDRIAAHKPTPPAAATAHTYHVQTQAALIERADTLTQLEDLGRHIARLPESVKTLLRPLYTARRQQLLAVQPAIAA